MGSFVGQLKEVFAPSKGEKKEELIEASQEENNYKKKNTKD